MPENASLEVKVLRSLDEVQAIRDFWSTVQVSPESDIDFFQFIVTTRPEIRCPYVLMVLQGGQPVALVAGRIEEGNLEFKVGYKVIWRPKVRRLAIFYEGFMGQTTPEVARLVVRRLLQALREEKADLLLWSGIRRDSELRRLLGRLPGLLCRDHLARPVERWSMTVPESLDWLLEQRMNKKHRYWIRRLMRLLEKEFPGEVRYGCYSRPEEVEELAQGVTAVARLTYQWGLGVGYQNSEENRRRLHLEAEKGWFRGFLLYLRNEPVAFWICTAYKGTVNMDYTGYNPAFSKYEVGTLLFLRVLQEMGREKVQHLDFGPGTASYKERFGDASHFEATMCVFASSARGIALNALKSLTQGPVELVRNLCRRAGLEQKIKKYWRARARTALASKEGSEVQA
jgi:CelD/BcsL family acetyltransferase involved in cellulose biosynthesis